MKIISKILAVILLCPLISVGQNLGSGDENITVNKLYTTNSFSLFTDNTFTPVMRYKDAVYFVHCDGNRKPKVGKIENGQTSVYDLDSHPNYYARDDRHHMWSIAVDKDGYIHVIGDMHNFPHSNNKDHLPQEYQNAQILYWVSTQPEDVSSFEFVGNDPARAIPGYAYSYYSFQLDMNHELYMLSRIRVRTYGLVAGINALGLFKYDADTKSWTALGKLPPIPAGDPPAIYPCIFWEDDGFSDNGWYQPYRASIRFDFNNRMHLATGVNNTSLVTGNTHLLYAYSDDGGITFHKADGSLIPDLPMRADPVPEQASIVDGPDRYDLFASVSFEENDKPIVLYTRRNETTPWGYDNATYRYWDDQSQTWSPKTNSPAGGLIKVKYLLDNRGIQNMIDGDPGGKVYRTYDITQTAYKATQINRRFHGMDEFGIHDNGILTGMTGSNTDNDGEFTISEVVANTYTIPIDPQWQLTNVGTLTSSVGQINDIIEFNVDGSGIGTNDNLAFVKQTLSGDGELIARVINVGYQSDNSMAGLMIRETNGQQSKMVSASISYSNGAYMHSRSTSGGVLNEVSQQQYRPSEWLKIIRSGDDFSCYRSDDGSDWDLIGSATIQMNQNVEAGFFLSSEVPGEQSTAHLDHVSLSSSISNLPPIVNINTPQDSAVFSIGDVISVSGTASDADGTISSVELLVNGISYGVLNQGPYNFSISGLAAGFHQINMVATDDDGQSSISSIVIEIVDLSNNLTFTPIEDAYLQQGVRYNTTELRIENGNRVTYLMFDVSGVIGDVTSATLKLVVAGDPGFGELNVFGGSHNNWTEETITSVTAPVTTSLVTSLDTTYDQLVTYNFDLSTSVQSNGTYSFIVEQSPNGNDVSFYSSEGSRPPELVITSTNIDCNGDTAGSAITDSCGVCAGGNTGTTPILNSSGCITSLQGIEERIIAYPNPTHSNIQLTKSVRWSLRNCLGQLIDEGEGSQVELTRGPGTYWLLFNNQVLPVVKF